MISDGPLKVKAGTFLGDLHLGPKLAYSSNIEQARSQKSVSQFWLKRAPWRWEGGALPPLLSSAQRRQGLPLLPSPGFSLVKLEAFAAYPDFHRVYGP